MDMIAQLEEKFEKMINKIKVLEGENASLKERLASQDQDAEELRMSLEIERESTSEVRSRIDVLLKKVQDELGE